MGIEIIKLLILAGIFAVLFITLKLLSRCKIKKDTSNKEKEELTTQAIFGKETVVNEDGIVETDGIYRVAIYATQVNMRTNSDMEKHKVWIAFRSFLNEIGLPYTFLQLSQYIDVRDYAYWYRDRLEKGRLTPELIQSGKDVIKLIENMDENRNSRDYSGYIIFQYDPDSDSIDSGVATGHAKLDEIIGRATGKKRMSRDESKNLSKMVLAEAVNIVRSYAEQMGMHCVQLNKAQVYGLSYKILQKDYANFSSAEEASESQCFTPFHSSVTASVLSKELQDLREEGVEEDAV